MFGDLESCGTPEEESLMAKKPEAVKEFLLKENEEFRRLVRKHRELDERITVLSERFLLSDEEKFEEATLKKKKQTFSYFFHRI